MPETTLAPAARHLIYDGNFRAGTIHYIDGPLRLDFWHEMGGGACHFYIMVPTAERWETETRTPLARRDEILRFVAETVQREKASSWRYEIDPGQISFY